MPLRPYSTIYHKKGSLIQGIHAKVFYSIAQAIIVEDLFYICVQPMLRYYCEIDNLRKIYQNSSKYNTDAHKIYKMEELFINQIQS